MKYLFLLLIFLSANSLAINLCSVKRRLMADRVCREKYIGLCPDGANAMMANCFPYPFGFNCGCGVPNASYKSAIVMDGLYKCQCSCEITEGLWKAKNHRSYKRTMALKLLILNLEGLFSDQNPHQWQQDLAFDLDIFQDFRWDLIHFCLYR